MLNIVGWVDFPTLKRFRIWSIHDDIIKWKHFLHYWPFVWGIHRSPVNCPHKGQWRGALMFSLICAWINGWVNNHEAGDLRYHRAHYDIVISMYLCRIICSEYANEFSCSTLLSGMALSLCQNLFIININLWNNIQKINQQNFRIIVSFTTYI